MEHGITRPEVQTGVRKPGADVVLGLPGIELTFVPSDPARSSTFVAYAPDADVASGAVTMGTGTVEVVWPHQSGSGVRRRRVPAVHLSIAETLIALNGLDPAPAATDSVAAWAAVGRAGLALVARGRLVPAVSPAGWDQWAVGPLALADRQLLDELGAALPPSAYAVPMAATTPLRMASPTTLIKRAWDAIADTLPRTAAAGAGHFAAPDPQDVAGLRPWLDEATSGLDGGGGADVALRVELGAEDQPDRADQSEKPNQPGQAPPARAVLQLTSRVDPSLMVDAEDLFSSPAAVLARFGADAETELLRSLRRGARAWPPLDVLLRQQAPTGMDLDEDLLADLLTEAASVLADTGIEVLWPAGILADGIRLHATLTATPGVVVEAGLGLETMVSFRWQATLDGEILSAAEIDQLADAKRGVVRLRGRWVKADPELLARLRNRRARSLSGIEALGTLLAGTVDVDGEAVAVEAEGHLADLADRLRAVSGVNGKPAARPPGLADWVELRPYQQRGVTWAQAMTELGLGGVLADDMGLGKTLQVIVVHLQRAAEGVGPTLVVCPTSLLGNWEREVRRFAPGTPVRRFHGPARSLDQLAGDEIVVASYGVARRDTERLSDAGFALVVVDEAQHAKNPETSTARALRAIATPARLALTGTPVENRLSDLWAILDWTTPGLLGPLKRFTETVATPIERHQDAAATERLASVVRPFLLRRRKTDPAIAPDLPTRTTTDVAVPLTTEQVSLYEAEVREALDVIKSEEGIARQALVLRLMTVLKQICNHPAQYLHQPGPLPGRSGKLAALEELISVIDAEGESVLVFSQFVECLTLIETRLAQLGVGTLFLHGRVRAKGRTRIVDAFQAGHAPVLLCSLKAGGVGLNLTRATHVIHYDRWWNPAAEDQATDRAHRIGQDRPVQVHRLLAEGTLEDRIASVIERKRSLAEAVVGGGERWIGQLSDDELADLVTLGGQR